MRQTAGSESTSNHFAQRHPFLKQRFPFFATASAVVASVLLAAPSLQAFNSIVVGSVRVQCLSDSLARLEVVGPVGFEDRETFHIVNRDWPGANYASNLVSGEVRISTANY